jgi:hypothetical protein
MVATGGPHGGVHAVTVTAETLTLLPGTGFSDAYRIEIGEGLTATQAMDAMFAHTPSWFAPLMAVRDRVMRLFGVKPAGNGPFPVVSCDDGRVVLGYDDSHLDFRLVGEVAPVADGRAAFTVTTLVRFNNKVGRAYIAAILPFHRLIARTALGNLARGP